MNSNKKSPGMEEMKVRFSTLWIFAMFNYLYADIMTLMNPGELKKIMTGDTGPVQITPEFLLAAAVLMEIAIAMVLLSRLLNYRANRLANMIAGLIQTAAVLLSLFVGTPPLFYIFFITIEVSCTLFIVWQAWRWKAPEASRLN